MENQNQVIQIAVCQTTGIDNLLMGFAKQGDEVFHNVAVILADAVETVIEQQAQADELQKEIVYDDFYTDYNYQLLTN